MGYWGAREPACPPWSAGSGALCEQGGQPWSLWGSLDTAPHPHAPQAGPRLPGRLDRRREEGQASLIRIRRPAGWGLSPADENLDAVGCLPSRRACPCPQTVNLGQQDGTWAEISLATVVMGMAGVWHWLWGQGKARPRAGGPSGGRQVPRALGLVVAGVRAPWLCMWGPRGKWVGHLPGWV